MTVEQALQQNLLIVAAVQFVGGLIGLISQRRLFQCLLCGQVTLMGANLAVAAALLSPQGQDLTAVVVLLWGLITAQLVFGAVTAHWLMNNKGASDISLWRSLRESERDPLTIKEAS